MYHLFVPRYKQPLWPEPPILKMLYFGKMSYREMLWQYFQDWDFCNDFIMYKSYLWQYLPSASCSITQKTPVLISQEKKNSMCGCQSLTIFAINNGPGPSCSTIERTQFSAPNLDSKASNFASFSEEVFHICKFVPSWSITQKKGWISSSIMQRMQWENSHEESIGAHSFFLFNFAHTNRSWTAKIELTK